MTRRRGMAIFSRTGIARLFGRRMPAPTGRWNVPPSHPPRPHPDQLDPQSDFAPVRGTEAAAEIFAANQSTDPLPEQIAPIEPEAIDRLRSIAVVGNSNSIMTTSFTGILERNGPFRITNLSIGASPSVLLLYTLAKQETWDFDYTIIETAVLDRSVKAGAYTYEQAREAIDLFVATVRARSQTRITIVVIPTRHSLVDPNGHWVDRHYRESAERLGIPILDGYALVRGLLGHRQVKQLPAVVARVQTLLAASGLPDGMAFDVAWRCLRDPRIVGNMLGYVAFADPLHLSPCLHRLYAIMLSDHFLSDAPGGHELVRASLEATTGAGAIITGMVAYAQVVAGGEMIERRSSQLERRLHVLRDGGRLTFRCPSGWKVVGLLVNKAVSQGTLMLESETTTETLMLEASPFHTNWIGVVEPLRGEVGDSDIMVSLTAREGSAIPPLAELCDMVLVRRDWRDVLKMPASEGPSLSRSTDSAPKPSSWFQSIDQLPSANARIAVAITDVEQHPSAANAVAAINLADPNLRGFLLNHIEDPALLMARLILMTGDFTTLRAHVTAHPRDDALAKLRVAVDAAFAPPTADCRAMLQKGTAEMYRRRFDEAEAILSEGAAIFPDETGFTHNLAWLAHYRGDWDLALARWAAVRSEMPLAGVGEIGASVTLRAAGRPDDAAAVIAAAIDRFPTNPAVWSEYARSAEADPDPQEALRRWAVARERFPDDPNSWLGAVPLLAKGGDRATADALLEVAIGRWPANALVLRDCMHAASARGDYERAVGLSRHLLLTPFRREALLQAILGLHHLNRIDEADALFADTSQDDHDEPLLAAWAALPESIENWAKALKRWRELQSRYPANGRYAAQVKACLMHMHEAGRA
jgi:tetratricopeptide (TPR) repeat protein